MAQGILQPSSVASNTTLQGKMEILLGPQEHRVGKLQLIVDGSREPESRRFGYVDVFLARKDVRAAVLLELRDLHLNRLVPQSARVTRGGWRPNPQYGEMERLAGEIPSMTEEELDQLRYLCPSEGQGQVFTTIGEIRRGALDQVEWYAAVLGMGNAQELDPGALDGRVVIGPGSDIIYSFALVAIGGRRVLWQSGRTIRTALSYHCVSA